MKIDGKGKYGTYLCLGIQTNKGNVNTEALKMAKSWAPKKAKSFTILKLEHTDYEGHAVENETGFAIITVQYYTTKKEGKKDLTYTK